MDVGTDGFRDNDKVASRILYLSEIFKSDGARLKRCGVCRKALS